MADGVVMWAVLRRPIVAALRAVDLYSSVSLRREGPLHDDGWFRSFREGRSVDADGEPIPWITYPAIDFLKRRVKSDMSVFEYGCGMSTLWWAARVSRIVSVEHDLGWYRRMTALVGTNVELKWIDLKQGDAYADSVLNFKPAFDIIVVDGRNRVKCLKNTTRALAEGGVVILDNSGREAYRDGIDALLQNGFRQVEFSGLVPIVNWKDETSVFYRPGNCLGI